MAEGDVAFVYEISKACFSESWTEEAIAKELINTAASYYVAEEEGLIIGYGGLWHMADEGEIINIAVSKQSRQKHVGSMLLSALLEEAKNHHVQNVFLEVRESNEAARALYTKFNFKEIGRRKNYYHHPTEDAINMSCLL